jgi:hypothetical protein
VLLEALLPATPADAGPGRPERAEERRRAAYLAQAEREARERHAAALERARLRREWLAALPGRIWSGLGEVGRPIAVGLAVALPAVVALAVLMARR